MQHLGGQIAADIYEAAARAALENGDLPEYHQCQARLDVLYAAGVQGCRQEFLAYRILYQVAHSAQAGGAAALLSTLRLVNAQVRTQSCVGLGTCRGMSSQRCQQPALSVVKEVAPVPQSDASHAHTQASGTCTAGTVNASLLAVTASAQAPRALAGGSPPCSGPRDARAQAGRPGRRHRALCPVRQRACPGPRPARPAAAPSSLLSPEGSGRSDCTGPACGASRQPARLLCQQHQQRAGRGSGRRAAWVHEALLPRQICACGASLLLSCTCC